MKLILLHGLGQTPQDWSEVVRRLDGVETECPPLFPAAGEVTYARIFAALAQRLSEIEEPVCLCGLSLGAMLALDYAAQFPENVAHLVLCGAQYKVPRVLFGLQNLLFRLMPASAFAEMGLSKQNVLALTRSMRALDLTAQLGGIACPTDVLCGENDRANRKAARELAARLPRAERIVLPQAGHELNRDAPEPLAALLARRIGLLREVPSEKD